MILSFLVHNMRIMLQNYCSKHEFSKFDTPHDDIYVKNEKRNFGIFLFKTFPDIENE